MMSIKDIGSGVINLLVHVNYKMKQLSILVGFLCPLIFSSHVTFVSFLSLAGGASVM